SATYQYSSGHPNFLMPADLDGPSAPPAGSPGYFYTMLAEGYPNHPAGVDRVVLYEFDVDWAVPNNSTFGIAQEIPIADYNYTVCGFFVGDCIPQPGTAQGIDSLSYWPMWRFAYRNLNSYEAMVGNFTVDVDGTDRAAIRWFELQNDGTSWSLHQEGTLAPDSDHRFMGSIAMDGSGNIALGYSVSSATTFPSIRYATRLRSDPLGTLQAEATMYDGAGSQTGIHRWGDYSSMSVDPADECTFWYTNEYHDVNDSGWNWNTRVGTFRLPECSGTIGADFTIAAEPAELSICTPDNAVYDVTVQYYTGYNSQVNLSASGLPAGATATFVPSSVITPTTASVLTIGTTGTTPGFYNVDIVGVGVPTPTHTTTVGLDLYGAVPGAVPLVSPADTATNVDLVPTFEWDTATQGGSYFLEVAEDSGFVTVVYSNTVAGLSDTPTIALTPLSTYYWRVTSTNACGVGSASAVYSFTTRDIPPILLVDDDDNGPDARAPYIAALDSAGAMYDIWDTGNSDNEPSLTDLLPYSTVIWFTGDEFGGAAGPGSAGEAALGSWLDGGKCLFLSGQDYYYDRGLTTFMTNYLGLASATNDNGDYTSVTGQNTVFGGLGPYSLTYPFTDYSDPVTPDSTAEVGFVGNNSNNAALTKDSGVYRTTFWAFPFEALSAANGLEVMTTVLNWCGSGADTGTLQGNVSSSVTATGIEGATVTAVDGSYQRTISTNAAGDYSMVVPVGTYDITAAATNYVSDTVTSVAVMTDTVVTVDFVLDGSVLTYSPEFIEEYMEIGDVVTNTVTVTNTGPLPIDFSVNIGNYGGSAVVVPSSVMPIDGSPVVVAPEAQEAPSTAGLTLPEAPVAQQLAAGDVIQSWTPTGMVGPWGIAFDGTDVWVSSPAPAWGGDNTLHEFSANGTPTGVVHNYTWNPSNGPGDATYNWNTGKLWVMNINSGVSNCIYEMDPATGFTGNTICPGGSTGFATSQRGLAYDPATDTYLAGSWNDQTVYRFAPDGTILEQVVVGLDISGLAYNPDTMHLFAMVNASPNPVYVLDAANNYGTVGQFNISQDFGDFSGAGLEFDCTGNLWAVDQVTAQVYQVESGETASLCGGANNWAYAVP
ncbi:MAG: carboxypeptidase regulatory-like domain-containing protein, partial [Anaerolineales bacterium]|nr:carboxypeptidase regulatory-like domain-containing protein [Anaerolineales bacterium]